MDRDSIKEIATRVATSLNLSDMEYDMLRDAMLSVYKELPNSKSGASTLNDELLSHKSNLVYMISSIKRTKGKMYREYRRTVDNKFTILVRQGRPSKDAIMSEIHSQSADLRNSRDHIDEMDELIGFIESVISLIENKMRIVDNKRYDLQ